MFATVDGMCTFENDSIELLPGDVVGEVLGVELIAVCLEPHNAFVGLHDDLAFVALGDVEVLELEHPRKQLVQQLLLALRHLSLLLRLHLNIFQSNIPTGVTLKRSEYRAASARKASFPLGG